MAYIINNRLSLDTLIVKRGGKAGVGIRLMPGLNRVKDELWARAKENIHVQNRLDRDEYVEQQLGDDGLQALSTIKAIKMVEKTTDVSILEGWLDDDRSKVKTAIKKQIERLTAPVGDPEE